MLAQAARSIAPPIPPPFCPAIFQFAKSPFCGDLIGAEHGHVDAAAANEAERIGVMHDRRAGVQRDVLPAGIDQMQIFPAGAGQRAVADDAVLGVEDDLLVAEIIIRAQGRDADAEIDDPAVLELHRQPVAHLLPGQPFRAVAHRALLCN